ncbi:conserved hypothetical protein [Chryseobacterium sp. 8AT]|nr:conserved hypothetical protein [Chryseobacterium sp. 8AT]
MLADVSAVIFIESLFSEDICGSFDPQLAATKPIPKANNINFFIILYFYGV